MNYFYIFLIVFTFYIKADTINNIPLIFNVPNQSQNITCDGCGCTASVSNGFDDLFIKGFIGVKPIYQWYQSKQIKSIFNNETEMQSEYFRTLLWMMKFPIYKKWDIMIQLPYHYHTNSSNQSINGIGDMEISAFYKIKDEPFKPISWLTFFGLKVPTGNFNQQLTQNVNQSFQLGSGSLDYIVGSQLKYSNNKFQVIQSFDYIYKNANRLNFRFGDVINASIVGQILVWKSINQRLVFKMGLQNEYYFANEYLGSKQSNTEGFILLVKNGLDFSKEKWNMGIETWAPIQSNLNQNNVENPLRLAMYIQHTLKLKSKSDSMK